MHGPVGGVPGLERARLVTLDNDREILAKYIISTPNTSWLPDIAQTKQEVRTRVDGRYGDHDFTQWPQWYFEETRHLAFVPRKPSSLSNHPRSILWHNLKTSDFEYEPGHVFSDLGKVSEDLLVKIMDIRRALTKDITELLKSDIVLTPIERHVLEKSVLNMQLSSVCLQVAPQSYFQSVCTFTLFQRYALEGLGCYDLVTRWSSIKAKAAGQFVAPLNVDDPVVGAITSSIDVTVDLASTGVPVWLVRPHHSVNESTIKIVNTTDPIGLSQAGLVSNTVDGPDSLKFSSHPSPARNRACVCLRLGHLHLGAFVGLQSTHPSINASTSQPLPPPPGESCFISVNVLS